MRRKLPPLNALKAFDSAARAGSFAKAAQELLVTQTAVSQQVKILEQYLDCTLFRRLPNGLALTPEAKLILPLITQAFDQFEDAVRMLPKGKQKESDVLVISTLPSFAQEWLLPRLVEFRSLYPEIDVLVQTEYKMVDLASEAVDIAIRFGRGDFGPDLCSDLLASETVTPVCSPSLVKSPEEAQRPHSQLAHYPLLNSSVRMVHEPWMSWAPWLEEAKIKPKHASDGPKFSDPLLILRAACAGGGVALGRSILVQDHLASGRLVKLFPDWEKPIYSSYFVVSSTRKAKIDKVAIFRSWILDQARNSKPAPATLAETSSASGYSPA